MAFPIVVLLPALALTTLASPALASCAAPCAVLLCPLKDATLLRGLVSSDGEDFVVTEVLRAGTVSVSAGQHFTTEPAWVRPGGAVASVSTTAEVNSIQLFPVSPDDATLGCFGSEQPTGPGIVASDWGELASLGFDDCLSRTRAAGYAYPKCNDQVEPKSGACSVTAVGHVDGTRAGRGALSIFMVLVALVRCARRRRAPRHPPRE